MLDTCGKRSMLGAQTGGKKSTCHTVPHEQCPAQADAQGSCVRVANWGLEAGGGVAGTGADHRWAGVISMGW